MSIAAAFYTLNGFFQIFLVGRIHAIALCRGFSRRCSHADDCLGVAASRRQNQSRLSAGGRSLPAFVLVFTLLSSWIGAGSLFAGAENAYRNGFAALWQPAGGWAGLLLIYFIAPRARKFAQFTIPDLLEARYNQTARVLGVIAILFAYTAIASYQLRGGGDILHLIFPDGHQQHDGNVYHRRIRHRLYRAGRHGIGRIHGCGHRPAGDGRVDRLAADYAAPGGRYCGHACRAAGNAFSSARFHIASHAPWSFSAHPAAHAGQPGHVSEVLLREI